MTGIVDMWPEKLRYLSTQLETVLQFAAQSETVLQSLVTSTVDMWPEKLRYLATQSETVLQSLITGIVEFGQRFQIPSCQWWASTLANRSNARHRSNIRYVHMSHICPCTPCPSPQGIDQGRKSSFCPPLLPVQSENVLQIAAQSETALQFEVRSAIRECFTIFCPIRDCFTIR